MVMSVQWREGQEVTGHFGVTARMWIVYMCLCICEFVCVCVCARLRANNVDDCVRGE